MAKKSAAQYICSNCAATFTRWEGKCSNCGAWNTLEQQVSGTGSVVTSGKVLEATLVGDKNAFHEKPRIQTTMRDVDAVLGGGFVPGSVILITGQPGIGKSTLLQQIAHLVAKQNDVLYVSGEESAQQVFLRSQRLGASAKDSLFIANSNSADDIIASMQKTQYSLVIVDSIQTIQTSNVPTSPGSPTQIMQSTHVLMAAAKQTNTAIILVGHVTKDGDMAGPKLLEHLVDVVLTLEGDRYGGFKLLRSVKNRFGSTNESGIFETTETGLKEVVNPSAALLAERQVSDGSVVLATMEGSRPLLVEVQALVTTTSFGYPKRASSGYDLNRLSLLIAMISRRTKLDLSQSDVFINIVGGLRISEPAADLAVCLSIASAAKGIQLNEDLVVFGEVGLSGEVRHVPFMEARMREIKKLGFKGAIGPTHTPKVAGLHSVKNIQEAVAVALKST